jgi:hypothetical protein
VIFGNVGMQEANHFLRHAQESSELAFEPQQIFDNFFTLTQGEAQVSMIVLADWRGNAKYRTIE